MVKEVKKTLKVPKPRAPRSVTKVRFLIFPLNSFQIFFSPSSILSSATLRSRSIPFSSISFCLSSPRFPLHLPRFLSFLDFTLVPLNSLQKFTIVPRNSTPLATTANRKLEEKEEKEDKEEKEVKEDKEDKEEKVLPHSPSLPPSSHSSLPLN